ncbi:hypothetical protein CHU98_g4330 [Xylaria longipes]|nr:hypothetical protein CHU98_g4330 [Xylaria longipes]
MAFGRTGSLTILDDLGEDASEDPVEPDSIAESVSPELCDEGQDFSLMGSAKRLGAIRRAMLDQYRARTMVSPRNARTETMLATIAMMRVLSKPAIVSDVCLMFMVLVAALVVTGDTTTTTADQLMFRCCLKPQKKEREPAHTSHSFQSLPSRRTFIENKDLRTYETYKVKAGCSALLAIRHPGHPGRLALRCSRFGIRDRKYLSLGSKGSTLSYRAIRSVGVCAPRQLATNCPIVRAGLCPWRKRKPFARGTMVGWGCFESSKAEEVETIRSRSSTFKHPPVRTTSALASTSWAEFSSQ